MGSRLAGVSAARNAARSSGLMASEGISLAELGISKPQRQRAAFSGTLAEQLGHSCEFDLAGLGVGAICSALVA